MSQLSIPVLKFLFRSDFKVLNDSLALNPSYEVEEFPAAIDLATYLSTIPAGLVITSLRDKNDLVQVATLMKSIKKSAQQTAVKVVVINFSGDKQFEKAIAKLGIQDMVEPAVNTKALKFKLDFWMKSLNGQIKNNPQANLTNKTNETKTAEKKTVENQGPTWRDPLELEDDIWILRQETDCKKVLSKWLIRLLGPSPYVGAWTELKNNLWRFDIKEEEKDLYAPGSGAWFFHGEQKPDFVWKENLWLITGETFDLFYKDGDQVQSRLKSKEKNLVICKNSLFAKTKEQVILESCDKELVFKKSAESLDDLEGKGKTDQLNGGPLSGKNKTSHLNSAPLAGDFNPNDDFLSSDPLTQKSQSDKQSGFMSGKLSPNQADEKNQKGPGSEGHRDGAELGLDQKNSNHQKHYKGHNPAEQFDPSDKNHHGPGSGGVTEGQELGLDRKNTDHQKHYKGHNPAEQFEAEKKEHEARKNGAKSSGPMSGKSSTDEMEGYYDNSGSKEGGKSTPKERELAGKSETDKMKSHYGGEISNSTSAKEQKERPRSDKDSPREGELSGKSETDKMKSHYGGETSSTTSAKEQKERSRSERDYPSASETSSETQEDYAASADVPKSDKKKSQSGSEVDPYADLFGKSKGNTASPSKAKEDLKPDTKYAREQEGGVISLAKAREERNKLSPKEEAELAELCADAKVTSFLTQNQKRVDCKLDDFYDDTIVMIIPSNDKFAEAKVQLDMQFKYLKKDARLNIVGEVVSIDDDGEGNNYVTIQVGQSNLSTVESFMKEYQSRQSNVNQFMNKVKGF